MRDPLVDATGRTVATFLRGVRDDLPLADDLEPANGASAELIVEAIEQSLTGHIVGAPRDIGDLLVARGAVLRRRSTLMECDPRLPRPATPVPDGVSISAASGCSPDDLLDAYIDAYPPDHPDHHVGLDRDGQRELLRGLMDGEVIGPLLGCARAARTAGGFIGAALVFDPGGEPPLGVPWIGELFRHPDAPRGTGAALLAAALDQAGQDGLPVIGLRVSDGNPARRLYDQLGFQPRQSVVTVLVTRV